MESFNPFCPPRGKTVVIPVMIQGGKMIPFYGGQLPRFKDGAVMDIVLEIDDLADLKDAERFEAVRDVTLFKAGEVLYFELNPKDYDVSDYGFLNGDDTEGYYRQTKLMPVIIEEDLHLRLRGTRTAQLLPCACVCNCVHASIPRAISLNQMLTFLSQKFEPWRHSHTGNVFRSVHYSVCKPEQKIGLRSLGELRDDCQAGHEAMLWSRSWPNMQPGG